MKSLKLYSLWHIAPTQKELLKPLYQVFTKVPKTVLNYPKESRALCVLFKFTGKDQIVLLASMDEVRLHIGQSTYSL